MTYKDHAALQTPNDRFPHPDLDVVLAWRFSLAFLGVFRVRSQHSRRRYDKEISWRRPGCVQPANPATLASLPALPAN